MASVPQIYIFLIVLGWFGSISEQELLSSDPFAPIPVWSSSPDVLSSEEPMPFVGAISRSSDNAFSRLHSTAPQRKLSPDVLSSEEPMPFVGAISSSSDNAISRLHSIGSPPRKFSLDVSSSEEPMPFVGAISRSSDNAISRPHSIGSPQRKLSFAFPPNRFCSELTNGFYRHPTNCSRILQCFNNKIFEYPPCRHGLVFNERIGFCDYLRTSYC